MMEVKVVGFKVGVVVVNVGAVVAVVLVKELRAAGNVVAAALAIADFSTSEVVFVAEGKRMEESDLAETNGKEEVGDTVVEVAGELFAEDNEMILFNNFESELIGLVVADGVVTGLESFNFLLFGLFTTVEVVVGLLLLIEGGRMIGFILLIGELRLELKALEPTTLLFKSTVVSSLFTVSSILNKRSLSS
jgi:hypothetical protein